MRFIYKQFPGKKKEIVQVDISRPTKVKFMTAREMAQYKKGRTHSYYGGTFDPGTVQFVLPFDSVWNAVVEKGGFRTPMDVQCSCRVLPPDREALSTVALDAPADRGKIGTPQNDPDQVDVNEVEGR